MRKSTRFLKKLMALFLVVLMSIESFAAAVSDNDGSAFITKAEFDSLKNNFQSQIDQYNTGIDAKIDSAIANYLVGNKVTRKIMPDILLNSLDDNRRTFTNDWINPTESTQDDLYLQISKNIIQIYATGHVSSGRANDTATFYALNTLSGGHQKGRTPRNNGGNGKYLLTTEYNKDPGKYYLEDIGLYDVKEVIEISGGQTTDSRAVGTNWFSYAYDESLDFSDKKTDSIWTRDFLVAYAYSVKKNSAGAPDTTGYIPAPMAGSIPPADKILSQTPISLEAMCSICVMESNIGDQHMFNTMSSGGVWTTDTGTIRKDGVHNWKYRYNEVALAGAGAQTYGWIYYYNTEHSKRLGQQLNIANNYREEYEPITFMGPLVEGIRGSDFIVKDVSDIANESLHYYSGLPLFKLPFKGKMTLKLALDFNNRSDTVIAIRNKPFDNTSIGTKTSNDIYWKKWNSADLSSGQISLEIPEKDLESSINKILYIKLFNTNSASNSDVRVYVNECVLEGD